MAGYRYVYSHKMTLYHKRTCSENTDRKYSDNRLHLLCVFETLLDNDIPDNLICPLGYDVFRYVRPSRAGQLLFLYGILPLFTVF